MFQSDAGSGSIQVIEGGNLPVQILIGRDQDFAMFLVTVQRQEQWSTSGEFHLRFLRRVPVLDKRCTVRLEGPFAGPVPSPSVSGRSSTEELGLSSSDERNVEEEEEEHEAADRVRGTGASPPVQTAPTFVKDVHVVPLTGQAEENEYETDLTDEEDHHGTGAAALRRTGGGIIPPGI